LTENSGFEISDGLLIAMVAGKVMTSHRLGPRGGITRQPDFNVIMEECMNDLPQKWKLAVTSKYLSEKKTEAICQELEITTSNYWQIVHRSSCF
jgi:RNA polymerase sigma-70 factor (ECF subfamily)